MVKLLKHLKIGMSKNLFNNAKNAYFYHYAYLEILISNYYFPGNFLFHNISPLILVVNYFSKKGILCLWTRYLIWWAESQVNHHCSSSCFAGNDAAAFNLVKKIQPWVDCIWRTLIKINLFVHNKIITLVTSGVLSMDAWKALLPI